MLLRTTPQRLRLLALIEEDPGKTLKDYAKKMGRTPSRAQDFLVFLIKEKLVEARPKSFLRDPLFSTTQPALDAGSLRW